VAFHNLPSAHEAGIVVGGTLRVLHWIGLIGGALFYVSTAILWLRAAVSERVGFAIQLTLTGIMLAATAYSQFRILPVMDRDRQLVGGVVEKDPMDFERLHVLSERLEGAVLLCGLSVVFMLSRESQ
jgi:hypothetical protein